MNSINYFLFPFAADAECTFPPFFPLRLGAESSSRPLTPSPPSKREAGELKLVSSLRGALALDILLLVEGIFYSPASPERRGGG